MIKEACGKMIAWFKRCRDSKEILLLEKYNCSCSEILTLEAALNETDCDREKLLKRISELKNGIDELPRGRRAFFVIYTFAFFAMLRLLTVFFTNLREIVHLNWEANPEYLMEFRATAVGFWQVWQWLVENSLLLPSAVLWLIFVYVIQARMLWFRAYNFIVVAGLVSFAIMFFWLFSISRLSFMPLL